MLVELHEDAHALGRDDVVEQDQLPQALGRCGDQGVLELRDHALKRQVHDLDVAHDVGLDHPQQVARRIIGPGPHLAPQLGEHEAGDEKHAEGRQHAKRDPDADGLEPGEEAARRRHRAGIFPAG